MEMYRDDKLIEWIKQGVTCGNLKVEGNSITNGHFSLNIDEQIKRVLRLMNIDIDTL